MNASWTRSTSSNDCTSTVRPAASELGGDVALRRRAGGDADHGAVHVVDAGVAAVGGDHHLLAVVERRMQEVGAVDAVAAGRPRGVARRARRSRRPAARGSGRRSSTGTNSTASASPSTAAAITRQKSASKPTYSPASSTTAKPAQVVAHAAADDVVGSCTVSSSDSPGLHLLGAAGVLDRRRPSAAVVVSAADLPVGDRVVAAAGGRRRARKGRLGLAATIVARIRAGGDDRWRSPPTATRDRMKERRMDPPHLLPAGGDLSRGSRSRVEGPSARRAAQRLRSLSRRSRRPPFDRRARRCRAGGRRRRAAGRRWSPPELPDENWWTSRSWRRRAVVSLTISGPVDDHTHGHRCRPDRSRSAVGDAVVANLAAVASGVGAAEQGEIGALVERRAVAPALRRPSALGRHRRPCGRP